MENLGDLANAIMGGCVTALFMILGYYVKQGLDARNGKIDRRVAEPAPHTCRFSGDLETMVSDVKKGMEEIFLRLMKSEENMMESVKMQGAIQATLATLTIRTEWLQSVALVEADNPVTGQRLVLFVDDQSEMFGLLRENIESEGFKVHVTRSYTEGESALHAFSYEFAIIDASLTAGAYDGIQLARLVCQRFPNVKPIIFSGHYITDIPVGCRFIQKPGIRELVNLLKEWK